jgi:hypothetical protein
MTTAQTVLMAVLPVVFCSVLILMTLKARHETGAEDADSAVDRGQIPEMVSGVEDQFSLSVYKSVYRLEDHELRQKNSSSIAALQGWRRPVGLNRTVIRTFWMPNRSSGIITAWSLFNPGGNETETGISPDMAPSPAHRMHA